MKVKFALLLLLFPIISSAPASAQVSGAAISMSCSPGQIDIPAYLGANSSSFTICTVSNPTAYEEVVELSTSISDENLSIHTIENVTVGPGTEYDFYVNVSGANEMLVASHQLTVTGNVTSLNGQPPPNSASSQVNLLVHILQYDNFSIPQNTTMYSTTFTGLEPPYGGGNLTITVPLFNNGNYFDRAKVGVEEDSREQWQGHNFSISLPSTVVNVAPFTYSGFEVLFSITNETNSSNWTLLENGSKVFTQDLIVFAESEFGCQNFGCNRVNSTILIEVYHLPLVDSDSDGVIDDEDLCPDTNAGATVDSNGCALNQLDSDSDGIMDDVDECPNTAIGQTVDTTGCPGDSLTDTDGDNTKNNSNSSSQGGTEGNNNGSGVNLIDTNETTDSEIDGSDNNQEIKPNNPDEDSIQAGISDSSSYILAGSIVFLALVILFVRRKQPPMNEIHSQFTYEESLFKDN